MQPDAAARLLDDAGGDGVDVFVPRREFEGALAHEDGERGRQRVLALPCWEGGEDIQLFQQLLQHIMSCSEICEYIGDSMLVAGRHPSAATSDDEPESAPCPVLVLRAFTQAQWSSGDDEYDPYADVAADETDSGPQLKESDGEVLQQIRDWVTGIIVDMKVRSRGTRGTSGTRGTRGARGTQRVLPARSHPRGVCGDRHPRHGRCAPSRRRPTRRGCRSAA